MFCVVALVFVVVVNALYRAGIAPGGVINHSRPW